LQNSSIEIALNSYKEVAVTIDVFMKKKLFCHKCKKTYDVNIKNIYLVKSLSNYKFDELDDVINFEGACFFKELNILRQKEKLDEL